MRAEPTSPEEARVGAAELTEEFACPACSGREQRELTLRWGVRIVRCAGCGLTFANPQPREEDLVAYYGPEYFRRSAGKFLDLPLRRDVRLRFTRYLAEVRRHAPGPRVLDVGCGTGLFLLMCREAGLEGTGIELSDYAAGIGREQLGLDIRTGRLEQLEESRAFDAVTMWDFLEHTRDPVAVLRAAREHLADDACLFLTVPNVGSWWARAMGSRWVGFEKASEHLFYFTRHSLGLLLRRAGFTPLTIEPHSWVCTAGFVASRGKRVWPGGGRFFDATTAMLRLDQRVVHFPSVNLIAAARKSS